jgi:hypothetical protein
METNRLLPLLPRLGKRMAKDYSSGGAAFVRQL